MFKKLKKLKETKQNLVKSNRLLTQKIEKVKKALDQQQLVVKITKKPPPQIACNK